MHRGISVLALIAASTFARSDRQETRAVYDIVSMLVQKSDSARGLTDERIGRYVVRLNGEDCNPPWPERNAWLERHCVEQQTPKSRVSWVRELTRGPKSVRVTSSGRTWLMDFSTWKERATARRSSATCDDKRPLVLTITPAELVGDTTSVPFTVAEELPDFRCPRIVAGGAGVATFLIEQGKPRLVKFGMAWLD